MYSGGVLYQEKIDWAIRFIMADKDHDVVVVSATAEQAKRQFREHYRRVESNWADHEAGVQGKR